MRHKWRYALWAVLVVTMLATVTQAVFGNWNWFSLQGDETYTAATWQAWNEGEEQYETGHGYAFGTAAAPNKSYWTSGWYEANDTFGQWYDSGPGF